MSLLEQFKRDYEAGLIQFRSARYEPAITEEELRAGAQPTHVVYCGLDGPYYRALEDVDLEEE